MSRPWAKPLPSNVKPAIDTRLPTMAELTAQHMARLSNQSRRV
jgi:hypothetical protein